MNYIKIITSLPGSISFYKYNTLKFNIFSKFLNEINSLNNNVLSAVYMACSRRVTVKGGSGRKW
jgi:hypothetical protein